MQASLLSNIRSNPDHSLLFHYSNFQHLREYRPRTSELPVGNLSYMSMRLEQNLARTLTHIAQQAPRGTQEHTVNSSSVFDVGSMSGEISTACKRFIDLLYDRSDRAYFVGSFVDAYDIFISCVFYIYLEQKHCLESRSHWPIGGLTGAQGRRLGDVNDVVNKCCTLIAGIESRFGAVKAFRRVLRDFLAVGTGQYHPEGPNSVRKTCP